MVKPSFLCDLQMSPLGGSDSILVGPKDLIVKARRFRCVVISAPGPPFACSRASFFQLSVNCWEEAFVRCSLFSPIIVCDSPKQRYPCLEIQSGGLAAAANYALDRHFPLFPQVHALARKLAEALHRLGVRILVPVETNMVFIDPSPLGFDVWELDARAMRGSNPLQLGGGSRIVLHVQTAEGAVDDLINLVRELKDEKLREGFTPQERPEWQTEGAMHVQGLWEGLPRGAEMAIKRKQVT
jgi:hypothetical protein